jgi:hypothetical protein
MEVAVGTPVGEAGPGALTGFWGLDELVEQPTRRYRRRFTIDLPTGGLAEALMLLESTTLTVSFLSRDFDALGAGTPEAASRSLRGGHLAVTLPVARRFLRVRLASPQSGDKVAAFRFDSDVVAEEAVDTGSHGSQGASLSVTDRQLILKRQNGSSTTPLGLSSVDQIALRVEPQNPRISIAIAGDAEGPRAVPLPPDVDPGSAHDLGAQLAVALKDQVARFQSAREPPTLPDPLSLELSAEADAPCRLCIHDFAVRYRLRRASFPDGAPKKVLRFKGGRRETQAIGVTVPSAITAASAQLRLAGDLGGGPAEPSEEEGPTNGTPAPEPPPGAAPSQLGIAVTAERPVVARVEVTAAAAAAAALTEFAVVDPPSAVVLSLLRDADGQPGELLAESVPLRTAAGPPALHRFAFAKVPVLPTGHLWAGLRVQGGRLVWMVTPAPDARVLEQHERLWRAVAAASGMAPDVLLPALAEPAADGRDGGAELDGQPLALTRAGPDTLVDFTARATAHAAIEPAGTEVALSIRISSTVKGPVTAFPPEVVYDLA